MDLLHENAMACAEVQKIATFLKGNSVKLTEFEALLIATKIQRNAILDFGLCEYGGKNRLPALSGISSALSDLNNGLNEIANSLSNIADNMD